MSALRATAAVALAGIGALLLGGCAGVHATATGPGAQPRPLSLPLATSVTTANGRPWAAVAMGHLDDPLNTFWQLISQNKASGAWADDSQATATATNGGLVLSASGTRLTVAVLPSQLLTFSPLITTTDGGQSWSTGLVPGRIAATPSSLAVTAGGNGLVLLAPSRPGGPSRVLRTSGAGTLTQWAPVTDSASLASSPAGRRCGLTGLDAVGWAGDSPVIGGACVGSRIGLLTRSPDGTWSLAVGSVPALAGCAATEILDLAPTGDGMVAIAAGERTTGGTTLVALRLPATGQSWQPGAAVILPAGTSLSSAVVGPAAQVALVTRSPAGAGLLVEPAATQPWMTAPTPPPGTATAAFGANGLEALAVDTSTLTVSRLAEGAWSVAQQVPVTIEYGSSG